VRAEVRANEAEGESKSRGGESKSMTSQFANVIPDQPIQTRRWKLTGKPEAPVQQDLGFRALDADLTLAYQLFRAGRSGLILQGITVPAERKARIRREIIACNFGSRYLLDSRGKPLDETFAQAFERLYGQPLAQPTINKSTT
jgi:hypothetical protein